MVLGYGLSGLAGSQTVNRTETITWTLKAGGTCSSQVNHSFGLIKSSGTDYDYIGTHTMHTKTDCSGVEDSVQSFKIGFKSAT